VLWLILLVGAPVIGAFFDSPDSVAIIRVLGALELLRGALNIGVVQFSKELEFSKLFAFQTVGTLADFVVSVGAAILLRNVWALVLGQVTGAVVSLVLSYVVHPYRPGFKVNRSQFVELCEFGQWVLGSSVLVFLLNEGDDVVLGKMLGVTALGLYQMAYRISNLPATEITHLISRVSFPVYSKLQDDLRKLREAYLQTLQVTTFISMPLAIGIATMAKPLTQVLLGSHWLPMVPAVQLLAFWGLVRSIGATFGPLFLAVGKPQFATRLQLGKLLILGALIYPLTVRWGMEGTSLAVVLNGLVINPMGGYLVTRELRVKGQEYVKLLSFPLYGSFFMFLVLFLFNQFVFVTPTPFSFVLSVVIGLLTYGSSMYLFELRSDYSAMQLIRTSWGRLL
jgi:lipopolysaccharide exporter